MNIEQKARAYDEALEIANAAYKDEDRHLKATLERIFPGLRESEGEKIRKELIEHIKDQQSFFISAPDCRDKYEEEENNKYNSWLAWLEKQGGKETTEWSEEDERLLNNMVIVIQDYYNKEDAQSLISWLKSLRSQTSWKPSDEQMQCLLSEVEAWTKGCPKQKVLESLYNDLKKLKGE